MDQSNQPTDPPAPVSTVPSRWRRSIDFIKDLSEVAKFFALLLAIAGLIGLYLPTARTAVQLRLNPSYWYYIGKTSGGTFVSEPFQHPVWSGGTAPDAALDKLPGSTMLTLGGGLHIGRAAAGGDQPIRANYAGGVCLHVKSISRRTATGDPARYIWAQAVRIAC